MKRKKKRKKILQPFFFLVENFCDVAKKRIGKFNKGNFGIKKNNRHILRKKNSKLLDLDNVLLLVTKTRQDSKKIYLFTWIVPIYC
jgi:hypothetical protein